MKKLVLGSSVVGALVLAVGWSMSVSTADTTPPGPDGIRVQSDDKNPWTGLKLNASSEQYHFAVVSDRTGGHREKVFSRAMYQINLLQPQFVMSVGDLIEGSASAERVTKEWDEFDGYVKKLEMPFFYAPGNHDTGNKVSAEQWGARYGRKYYHFTYKNVLFLVLSSDNVPLPDRVDAKQIEYAQKTLDANKEVRWTFVFIHRPVWSYRDVETNGWTAVEKMLMGRKYTVFCGHEHVYRKYVRNGMNYYQLATTGGGSKMRGVPYREFDHVAWVTMKPEAPVIANIMLDGILPEDLKLPDSDEKGLPERRFPTQPVTAKLTLDGVAIAGATIRFHRYDADRERWIERADGLTDMAGRAQLTTYSRFDGCPVGEYVVTVFKAAKEEGEEPKKSLLPEVYSSPKTSTLKVVVKEGTNTFDWNLSGK